MPRDKPTDQAWGTILVDKTEGTSLGDSFLDKFMDKPAGQSWESSLGAKPRGPRLGADPWGLAWGSAQSWMELIAFRSDSLV